MKSDMTALELSLKYKTLLNKWGCNTPLRKAMFFAQLEAESGLKAISENLNYSAQRLLQIFPKYFKTLEEAKKYERNPQKIANRVYANRGGNGDEKSNEGWKYRGKGMLQITLKDNYKALSKDTGVDYVNNPDLLLNEADSIISALWFFKKNNIWKYVDSDNLDAVSDLINIGRVTSKYGDANGFSHRKELLEKNKKIFGV